MEQVQHEALQQPAAKQQKQHKREFPSLGLNEEGYPMFRGAPNCAYYMGTGRCDFNVRCKFHHPPYALHPECVAKGEPSAPPSLMYNCRAFHKHPLTLALPIPPFM